MKDSERRYIDFQKLKYEQYFDNISLKIGNDLVFWGVNESFNIVDIINQSNLTENISGTKKLGQPMLSFNYFNDYGSFDFYFMPLFVERQFPGKDGRPRLLLEIDKNTKSYQSSLKQNKLDLAVRYSGVIEDFDFGISLFHGNNRTPELNINPVTAKLETHYPILTQTSIDLQSTKGPYLYKLESLYAKNENEKHFSAAGSIEYTFYGIRETPQDLGFVIEYIFDDRNNYPNNNEGVLATRWTKNDINSTSLLTGVIFDLSGRSNIYIAEFERRIRNDLKVFIDTSIYGKIDKSDFTHAFNEDSRVTIKISKYF